MPSPAAPYLCSQLASVTKGLCKPLPPANRFLPTSEGTAADAAAYLSARHAPKHVCLFSFFLVFPFFFFFVTFTCFRGAFQPGEVVEEEGDGGREGGREEGGMRRMQKQESKQRQGRIQEGLGGCREPPWKRLQSVATRKQSLQRPQTMQKKIKNYIGKMFPSSNPCLSFAPVCLLKHTRTSSPL